MKFAMKALLASLMASVALASFGAEPEKKTFRLKFAHHNPPTSFLAANGFAPWVKAIETRTGGQVKIDVYPSSMLGKAPDAYDNTIKGVTDIAWSYVAFFPGRFPLTEVINLPMLGIDKATLGSKVIWDLYQNSPYIRKEFADVKVLTLHCHDGAPIVSKKPIVGMADMQGKKIRTGGGPLIPLLQSLGSSPMAMPSPDTYQAAEKGVIDGAVLAWEAVEMMNLQEILKSGLDANVNAGVFFLVMNKKTWDALPPEVQKVFDEESGEKASQLFARAFDETKKMSTAKFVKAGGKIATLDAGETAKWRDKGKLVWDKWASDLEAKGQPGKAVLDLTVRKVDEYAKQM
ncbi:TRAP transporter substrate-binding protein [Propionivibrio dicarboxylicus]|uniref:TRAP-type C4-dicarboxylate transport system, substrate-binding protein n=1 Tax=Propionivibrio dicarboxylicus TaxID=83767 RepID=A0A1G8HZS2_9RHOO|nr:TRAP transporter substrate-binding protein [Propionivibrio dicarboxylicus]SDI12062.1 TRAP-type C4-dicarboxylate transport system, substrate-binding protein [Propionivibrio dicarboxylicus]